MEKWEIWVNKVEIVPCDQKIRLVVIKRTVSIKHTVEKNFQIALLNVLYNLKIKNIIN